MNKSNYGNCIWDDSISLLIQESSTSVAAEEIQEEFDLYEDFDFEFANMSELKENVVIYVAGYIQKKTISRYVKNSLLFVRQ